jgi:enterochelin esterase-like enzyme
MAAGADGVSAGADAGALVTRRLDSRVLRANPLGDPAERDVIVHLPPSYRGNGARAYPVVFWLAGYGSTSRVFTIGTPLLQSVPDRLDGLFASGAAPEFISVFPDFGTRLGGSQYVNSTATGRYHDYLVDELVPFVDGHFRTVRDGRLRALVGRSSGGFGAFHAAATRPDVFGVAACHSPDAGFEYSYLANAPAVLDVIAARGGFERFARDPQSVVPKDGPFMLAMSLVCMAACYSPCPDRPGHFDFPWDPETGAMDPAVWERWVAFDPVRMVPTAAAGLRSLQTLFVDVGTRDEYHMRWGARWLHHALEDAGVDHVYAEHDGSHQGNDHRYDEMLAVVGGRWSALLDDEPALSAWTEPGGTDGLSRMSEPCAESSAS